MIAQHARRAAWLCGVVAVVATAVAACTDHSGPAVAQLAQARRLSTALLVRFTKASDASNRAVMADTDQASDEFAQEAKEALRQVQDDATSLEAILRQLRFYDESRLLHEFDRQLGTYRALDQTILELAVANTNIKAQHLAFGAAQAAVDGLRDALAPVAGAEHARDTWQARALVATTMAAVRQVQVLEAPHIAEPDDTAMTRIEKQMADAVAEARAALDALSKLVEPPSRPHLAEATSALDRFVKLNAQIVVLSRRNTNVHSLALSLGQKRGLTAACENSLRALQDALAKRGFSGTR